MTPADLARLDLFADGAIGEEDELRALLREAAAEVRAAAERERTLVAALRANAAGYRRGETSGDCARRAAETLRTLGYDPDAPTEDPR